MRDMANDIIRELYRPKTLMKLCTKRPLADLRYAIASSKRFVLDASMSEFMAALSTVPFEVANERRPDVLNSLRHSARLPADKVFMQINGAALRKGLLHHMPAAGDMWGQKLVEPKDVVQNPCVLFEQVDPETISCTYFCDDDVDNEIVLLPYTHLYRTDDFLFPDNKGYDFIGSALGHGLTGYYERYFAMKHSVPLPKHHAVQVRHESGLIGETHYLAAEMGGIIRYNIAFLATLSDIPTLKTEVRPSKGYFARGNYRKYVDHTVLTLQLPRKSTMKTLARRLIAMARRRWHEVEPHWRINKKPHGTICEPSYKHLWSERDNDGHSFCSICEARRVWIVCPHGRGDPLLGVVRHTEVNVTHRE